MQRAYVISLFGKKSIEGMMRTFKYNYWTINSEKFKKHRYLKLHTPTD